MTADLSVVAEMREHALEESWALRLDAKLEALARHVPPVGWDDDPVCRSIGTWLFFPDEPDDGTAVSRTVYDRARAVCRVCPVRLSCLVEHLDEASGCFAGTSPKERRRLRTALTDRGLEMAHVSIEHRRQDAENTRRAA